MEAATKEVNVAAWLASHEFPAATVATESADGPMVASGLSVTFWNYINETGPSISAAELGEVLRDLHAIPSPTTFGLPPFSPMPKVESRLAQLALSDFPESRLTILRERFAELSDMYSALSFELPIGPIHGDAHVGNLMRSGGRIVLIDLEDFCFGPREWDAAVFAVRYQAFGWESRAEYERYVEAYGYDPIQWSGFAVVRAIRELNMTTWLAQRFDESPEVAAEVLKRVADLRDDQARRDWRVF
jgi:aminoglycoside phosphotransferase (APT) family kinase protein